MTVRALVAAPDRLLVVDSASGERIGVTGLEGVRPTGLAYDPDGGGRVWCSTQGSGVFVSHDGGVSWHGSGLEGERLMSVAAGPGHVWAGGEPSAVWRSGDGGATWDRTSDLETLPSSPGWSFPPRPDTHHVRWISPHPDDPDRLWVAVEAGALVSTSDGGRTWADRVEGSPRDTHELAIHPALPRVLRSAAGDGYFESRDEGVTWTSPGAGLEVGYLRSVAVDPANPEITVVSAAPRARAAYAAGSGRGSVYRREGDGPWTRVSAWPDPPETIAPLLASGPGGEGLWAADERGVQTSGDGGRSWRLVASFTPPPAHLRGLVVVPS